VREVGASALGVMSGMADVYLGKIQLATELTVGADTFEAFDIYNAPTTIGFHLREFNVRAQSHLCLRYLTAHHN
jgi:hypothetical protein